MNGIPGGREAREPLRDARPLVAHLIDEIPVAGAERLIVDLLRQRSPRFRYAVVCLVRGGALEAELAELGVPVVHMRRQSRWDVLFMVRLIGWMRREHVRIVHTHLFTADT